MLSSAADCTRASFARADGFVENAAPDAAKLKQASRCFQEASSFSQQPHPGSKVWIHVYELIAFDGLNQMLASEQFLVGGALHAGVEVYSREWSYGGGAGAGTGVVCEVPKSNQKHRYRESVSLGYTKLSDAQVTLVIGDLLEKWNAQDYHWLRRNCLAFANEFCERLGVGRIPAWVDRLARGVGALDEGVHQLVEGTQAIAKAIAEGVGPVNCGCRPLPTAQSSYVLQSFVVNGMQDSFHVLPYPGGQLPHPGGAYAQLPSTPSQLALAAPPGDLKQEIERGLFGTSDQAVQDASPQPVLVQEDKAFSTRAPPMVLSQDPGDPGATLGKENAIPRSQPSFGKGAAQTMHQR